jgi:hypothetical protein
MLTTLALNYKPSSSIVDEGTPMEQKRRQSMGKYKEEFDLLQSADPSFRSGDSPQPREASETTRKLEDLWSSGGQGRGGEDLDEFLSGLGDPYIEEGRVKWDPPPDHDPIFVDYLSRSVEALNDRLQTGAIRIDAGGEIRPA